MLAKAIDKIKLYELAKVSTTIAENPAKNITVAQVSSFLKTFLCKKEVNLKQKILKTGKTTADKIETELSR